MTGRRDWDNVTLSLSHTVTSQRMTLAALLQPTCIHYEILRNTELHMCKMDDNFVSLVVKRCSQHVGPKDRMIPEVGLEYSFTVS